MRIRRGHRPDYVFLATVFVLVIFGLLMLSSASSDIGKIRFNDTFSFLKRQIVLGLTVGLTGFFAAFFVYYKRWQAFAVPFLLIGILLLVLVFTPLGTTHGTDAKRWLDFGPIGFQPAELLKIIYVLYLAAWISGSSRSSRLLRRTDLFSGYFPFLIISGIIALLIFIQPSTTTAVIILASGMVVYFVGGAKFHYVFGTFLIGALAIASFTLFTDYRFDRIKTFFYPEVVSSDDRFQAEQAKIAIGSGGLFGVGYGQSTLKYKYLPEPYGDSIFAVIAEELGFVGAIFLITLFVFLLLRGFFIARRSPDDFAKLLVIGFISVIGVQAFIHISAVSGLLPYTGIPLPFISYGPTSLAVFLTMTGIIGNISRYTEH